MQDDTSPQNYLRHSHYHHKHMAKELTSMTKEQKIKRFELENSKTPLTPAERVLLAALNDLKEGEANGKDLELALQSVAQAERAVAEEGRTPEEVAKAEKDLEGKHTHDVEVTGAENVRRVQGNEEKPVTITEEVKVNSKNK